MCPEPSVVDPGQPDKENGIAQLLDARPPDARVGSRAECCRQSGRSQVA